MAGDGTLATTAIITGGLTCGHGPLDPCRSGLITSPFSLYCTSIYVPPVPDPGGGPYPCEAWNNLAPGEIQNFYQPVPVEYYMVPRDQEANYLRRYKKLKITMKFGDFMTEKEFLVPETQRRVIVEAFNLVDITQQRIKVMVEGLKKVAGGVSVSIRKFRKRNK